MEDGGWGKGKTEKLKAEKLKAGAEMEDGKWKMTDGGSGGKS